MHEHLLKHVGTHATMTTERKGKRVLVNGMIDRAERVPGTTITTDHGTFLACRFRIKLDDGSRAVWSCAFADEKFPARQVTEGEEG